MGKKLFKLRDTSTGKFWTGDCRQVNFTDTGRSWSTRGGLENNISYFIKYRSAFNSLSVSTDTWEIVEVETKEVEIDSHPITNFMNFLQLKAEASDKVEGIGFFMDTMYKKKVLDKIEFIFKIKPAEGKRYVDFDRIKEARAHLRQLGIKTRSFKETRGVFGMMDREQALKARLVLDVDGMVDLGLLRQK